MRSHRLLLPIMMLFLLLPGCLYIHTVQPLTVDMHRTPVGPVERTGSLKLITYPPLSGDYRLVAWDSAAIGDIAKKQGMQEVYFADLETFSILRIWNEYTVHVYGK